MKSNKDRAMKENKNTEMPSFVYRDGMTADKGYVAWLSDVKTRFRQSQIKATIRVNTTMLQFYWSIGRDLVTLRAEERWGTGVVKQFALDMRQAFPDATGFSHTNVKYMKQWYSFYFEKLAKSHQVGDQLTITEKSHQVVGQLETISIDYGVMERADNVYVHNGNFGWSDVGTWGSVYQHGKKDRYANALSSDSINVYDTRNSLITVPKEKIAVVSGLKDSIVVDTADVLLICPMSDEQSIKSFIEDVKFSSGDKHI